MNERNIALKTLLDIEDGMYLGQALKRNLEGLTSYNRRFAAALVFTTLENRIRIDYVIAKFTDGRRIQKLVRNALRLGVCQLLYFESVPTSAAVNETVQLVARSGKRQLKGFANAVLRKIVSNLGEIDYPDREKEPARYLSVMYSYPMWICEMYIEDYGFDFAWEMLSYHKSESYISVRVNTVKTSLDNLKNKLDGRGVAYTSGKYLEDCLHLKGMEYVEEFDLYKKGLLTVQGESSMLVCRAAGVKQGDTVLDTCAAPGGKSAYIAAENPASLEAWDIHAHRVALMEHTFKRLGVEGTLRVQDATVPVPEYEEQFDVVLVDAPCSALGLLYRKPDIKYNKEQTDLEAITKLQWEILSTCARYVKPGGSLVYATCTINKRENDEMADRLLNAFSWLVEGDLSKQLPMQLAPRIRGGRLQLFPHIDGTDGFFISMMERV